MQLTLLQRQTCEQILDLYDKDKPVKVDFKAPTGSGKTLMASFIISALIEKETTEKFIFVVATPSSSSLPEFFEKKLNKYKSDLPYGKFEAEYIQSPSSAKGDKIEGTPKIIPAQNKVYIFGKASFGKGRIFSERGIINDFILSATDKGFALVYIRDESHIGGKKSDDDETKKFESLMQGAAKFVLKMTATPDYKDTSARKVILRESDLNNPSKNDNKFLLKTTPKLLLKYDIEDSEILKDAIENFKKIQSEYKTLGLPLRPCMLLQVDNEPTNKEKKKFFLSSLEAIKTELCNNGLAWAQYFGNTDKDSNRVYKDNFTLDEITEPNSEIDIVIFKIGPSTGWDIPRACMLVQLRDVCSSSLNAQTIGRIKRNSYPNLEKNEITDKYYIYSNATELDKDIKVYNYDVKEKFKSEFFAAITIANKKEITKAQATAKLNAAISDYLTTNKNNILQQLNKTFVKKGNELIYKKVRYSVNGNEVYSGISNPFIFLKEYKRLVNDNKFIYDKINKVSDDFYKQNIKNEKICDNSYNALPEYFYIVLFEKYKTELIAVINKHKQFKPIYKVDFLPYDPKSYSEIYDGDPITERAPKSNYLFDITNGEKNRQPLDSKPEKVVFNKLYDFAEGNEKVRIWAKNLTSSNISGEYLDDDKSVRRSFFDFVVKFDCGACLYIEVKDKNDINLDKTKQLKVAYANYFEKQGQKSLFEEPLSISVWQVNNDSITHETFYDKNKINKNLNALTVENLLKTISDLNLSAIVN
ncbi:MAG: DEAD/DEAH box helicase family protein [Endomicrobium sp.]|nr:DEAD/DEAH box helicase family protein [Endomicrobium sp.]